MSVFIYRSFSFVTGNVEVERAGRMNRFVSIWMRQKRTRKWFDLIKTQQQQLSHQNIRLTTRSSSLFLLEKPLTQFIRKSKNFVSEKWTSNYYMTMMIMLQSATLFQEYYDSITRRFSLRSWIPSGKEIVVLYYFWWLSYFWNQCFLIFVSFVLCK